MSHKDDLLRAAYLAGFNASGEGWNGEYPFHDKGDTPESNPHWIETRDKNLAPLASRLRAAAENSVCVPRSLLSRAEGFLWVYSGSATKNAHAVADELHAMLAAAPGGKE